MDTLPTLQASRARRKTARRKLRVRAFFAFSGVMILATAGAAAFFMSRPTALWVTQSLPASPVPDLLAVPGSVEYDNPDCRVTEYRERHSGIPFTLVAGGVLGTRRSRLREGVPAFVSEAGAQAGLNGTFFADAALAGTDNVVIGPTLCGDEAHLTRGPYDKALRLAGRPLVLAAPRETRIVPYDPASMDSERALRHLLPGVTDAFLGGVWLVKSGVPANAETVASFGVHDADDVRRRAFFALSRDGSPVLGATTDVTTSTHLASALAASGVREAVLMDSGFSTSLVDRGRILVTGHTAPDLPSRPVPHALVLFAPDAFVLSPLAREIVEGETAPSCLLEPLSGGPTASETLPDTGTPGPRKPAADSPTSRKQMS